MGTRSARSAITWTCSTGVFGWVEVVVDAADLRGAVVDAADLRAAVVEAAGLRGAVARLVVAGLRPRGLSLLVAIDVLPTSQDIEV